MNPSSIYGAFNARWLSPEDVARSFVPTTHFKALVKFQHSLLMGPRGCGKTTLLKMLTRPAQTIWWRERVPRSAELAEYPTPDFEAIYVPSDVRWSYELEAIAKELSGTGPLPEIVQRASVGISSIMEATRSFESILQDSGSDSTPLLKAIIRHLQFGPTAPSFSEIRLKLLSWSEELHSLVVARDHDRLMARVRAFPPSITGHATDPLIRACTLFEEYVPNVAPKKWALCFDELEIAPLWLQTELLKALRSFDQHFLLKLTWSPILPIDLVQHQERQHDYAAIRMWHSHASEARPFAQQFSTSLLRDRLDDPSVTPHDVLGVSPFAQDDGPDGRSGDSYAEGSNVWQAMVSLAAKDREFSAYLLDNGLDPKNPVAGYGRLRDEVLRKVKPIVLIRDAYLKEDSGYRRSRKVPPIYYGEDAIYSMSEGNPRMLAGLLNELVDSEVRMSDGIPRIRPELQARVLFGASQRMRTGIRTYPAGPNIRAASLGQLIDSLGAFSNAELVGPRFNPDPIGSFTVDQDVASEMLETIKVGLLIGAFVYVGSSTSDVPLSVLGARIRLSYMLAPYYKLLFRNYRPDRLSTVLKVSASTQRSMFWTGQERE